MKFKAGNRVKVRKGSRVSLGGVECAGLVGRVISIHKNRYPYYVQLDSGHRRLFHANELVKEV